jgi:hypothetical protein
MQKERVGRKRAKRDILVFALGLATGGAAGYAASAVNRLASVQKAFDKGSESVVNFASWLFKWKKK